METEFPQDLLLIVDPTYPYELFKSLLSERNIIIDSQAFESIYASFTLVQRFVFSYLLDSWVKNPSLNIQISQVEYVAVNMDSLPNFPEEFLRIVSNSPDFNKRIEKIILQNNVQLTNFRYRKQLWTVLTNLANIVPFITLEVKTELPKPIEKIVLKERPTASDHAIELIQSKLREKYTLSPDKKSLIKISKESPLDDKINISSANINTLFNGKWIPAAFLRGTMFAKAGNQSLYRMKIKKGYLVMTGEELGKLIYEQIKIVFPDLELPVSEP